MSRRCFAGRCGASLFRRRRGREPPIVHFDNEHSRKYTVLEIVADDAPGLLYRISRVISAQGCDVELVLIATEGKRAIDVLHVMKGRKAKLSRRRTRSALSGRNSNVCWRHGE